MNKILYSVTALMLLASCAVFAQKTPQKQKRDKSEDEIIAAVVRYATQSQRGIVFLRVDGHDPSPETLSLLTALYVRVLPASRAVYSSVPYEIVSLKDKKTGELGFLFDAEVGKRISDTRVTVGAGWWQACDTYTLILQNGSWSVENYKAGKICF